MLQVLTMRWMTQTLWIPVREIPCSEGRWEAGFCCVCYTVERAVKFCNRGKSTDIQIDTWSNSRCIVFTVFIRVWWFVAETVQNFSDRVSRSALVLYWFHLGARRCAYCSEIVWIRWLFVHGVTVNLWKKK